MNTVKSQLLVLGGAIVIVLLCAWIAPDMARGAHQSWTGGCVDPGCTGAEEAAAGAACAADGGSFWSMYIPGGCEGTTCYGGGGYWGCDIPDAAPTCATNPTMDGCSCTKSNACNATSGSYSGGSCDAAEPAPCPTCAAPVACTSSPNSCGMTSGGSIECNGNCSAVTPSDALCGPVCVPTTGNGCTSSPNSCGMTDGGSIQCDGSCSATTPPDAVCPATCVPTTGNGCTSSPNSCGMTSGGSIECDGSCSAVTPPEALCGGGGGGADPSVSCSPVTSTVAAGTTVNFTATPADGAGPPYTWIDGSGNVLGTGANYSQVFNAAGNVRVRANDGAGGTTPASGYCTVNMSGGGACTNAGPLTITATPNRVNVDGTTAVTLNWTADNVAAASCTVTNLTTSTQIDSATVTSCGLGDETTGPITGLVAQTTFRLTCGSLTKDVVVNVIPRYEEF